MKKVSIVVMALALLVAAPLLALGEDPPHLATVEPLGWDFGELPYGEIRTVIFTLTNISTKDIIIYEIYIPTCNDGGPLCITNITPPFEWGQYYQNKTPAVLPPAGKMEIEVTFSSHLSNGQIWEDVLFIEYLDMDIAYGYFLPLKGKTVASKPPPEQQIADILAFFDAHMADGTLVGCGPAQSAVRRWKALRNMLVASGDLIRAGDTAGACQQLLDAYNRTDGIEQPPDFVSGEAAPTLAGMIAALREDLNCP